MTIALAAAAPAVGQQSDRGLFEVRSASTELKSGIFYLTASVDLRLPEEATQALASGLPLTIRFEIEFLNRLRLWWDFEAATLRQLRELEYHPLTERFVVVNENSGDRASFSTLAGALSYVGRIESLPLIDASVLDEDRRYDVRLRALLDTEQLPGPLRLLAFWRRDWSIGSEWFTWRLDEE